MQPERLGPYKITRLLGRGGMGAVYAAVNDETGEQAAIKLLSGHLADDEAFQQRFKQEVESLKRLLHPHIVQLFGFGEQDGHLYYAMELIEGRTLQEELTAGRRFHWREVVRLGIAISQALKHAHDRGIIHRDLKPANLLLDTDDHVKLADFGIAKLYGGTQVTAAGGVLGTADYMAPEQARGQIATTRCDLYSLGCVMYALLSGRPPFVGKSMVEVVTALQNDEPLSVRYWAADTPEPFDKIILQLLEKDPQRRIPTALALMNQLKAMEHALSLETRVMDDPESPRSGPPLSALPRTASKTEIVQFSAQPTAPFPVDKKPKDQPRTDDAEYRLADDSPTSITGHAKGSTPSSHTALSTQAGKKTGAGFDSDQKTTVDPSASKSAPAAAKPNKFTPVSPAELRGGTVSDDGALRQWLAAGVVAFIGLVAISMAIYLATRPPSADRLYSMASAAAQRGEETELIGVEGEISRFLELYPHDPRAPQMAEYARTISQFRQQRQIERRGRYGQADFDVSPVELAYADAMRLIAVDPETTLARLEALVAVYGRSSSESGDPSSNGSGAKTTAGESEISALAQKEIERLRPQVEKLIERQTAAVRRELQRAEALAKTDQTTARKIWQGIITLYGNKPWAQALVEEAQRHLRPENSPPE